MQRPMVRIQAVTSGAASQQEPPSYAGAFRCIGPACEDTCCRGWTIPVDQTTYETYTRFPPEKLGDLVSAFVTIQPAKLSPSLYAEINLTPTGACAFFDADRLCRIQKEYGPGLLSATCSSFPRVLNQVDTVLEGSLSLSCPEAARNVLLEEGFLGRSADLHSGAFRTDNYLWLVPRPEPEDKVLIFYQEIRELLLEILSQRSLPISKRLLVIGVFCTRLQQALDSPEISGVRTLLDSFRSEDMTALARSFERYSSDPRLRVDVLLALSNERASARASGRRFQDVFWEFVEGIGSPAGSDLSDDVSRFLEGERDHLQPFLARHPSLQENLLTNYMNQHLFPFGRKGSEFLRSRTVSEEYLLMTTQFAWIHGLLAGIAMGHPQDFSSDHIVKVVQSLCRAVEHSPGVLDSVMQHLQARGLANLEGMAILLG